MEVSAPPVDGGGDADAEADPGRPRWPVTVKVELPAGRAAEEKAFWTWLAEDLRGLLGTARDRKVGGRRIQRELSSFPLALAELAVLAGLAAVGTALVAFVINISVENLAGAKFSLTFGAIGAGGGGGFLAGYVVHTSVNCLLVSGAAYVVTTFAPAAAGSGIPEVKSYLNGLDLPFLSFKTLVGKVVGCVLSVAGGLVVGKEGPLVHVGACIASLLSESTGELARDGRLPPTLKGALAATRGQAERRDTITCGACAGVAAAFRAPVGGVLFAIEEISSFWSQSLGRTFEIKPCSSRSNGWSVKMQS